MFILLDIPDSKWFIRLTYQKVWFVVPSGLCWLFFVRIAFISTFLIFISTSTVSTSITFEVTATPGTNPIAGFECSLDGSSFSTCATTNPATINFDDLADGQQHTFEVRAVDTEGNEDLTPATFTWTILTPQQAVEKLSDTINSMELSRGTTTSLEAPLRVTIRLLNANNDVAACNTLNAFLSQVDAREDNGRLSSRLNKHPDRLWPLIG